MYWDETIKLSDNLPDDIQEGLNVLEKLHNENREDEFDDIAFYLDIDLRSYMVSHRITEEDGFDVQRKIGYR